MCDIKLMASLFALGVLEFNYSFHGVFRFSIISPSVLVMFFTQHHMELNQHLFQATLSDMVAKRI